MGPSGKGVFSITLCMGERQVGKGERVSFKSEVGSLYSSVLV